ncbi:MAG: response regulator transcription factor [Chryseolinea sp.]
MKNNIVVYLADDHPVVRKGMIRLLSTFKRVGEVLETSNGRDLIKLLEKRLPDAVIIDVEMPQLGGVDTAKYINEHFPNVKILVLTMHTEEVIVNRLMDLGVHGFLSKANEPEEIEKALYSIVDKDFYRNAIVDKALSKMNHSKEKLEGYTPLSQREIEILLLICQELSPGEISERLSISEKTFFNHRQHILDKTGARGNVGLVKFAHQKGFIELSGKHS